MLDPPQAQTLYSAQGNHRYIPNPLRRHCSCFILDVLVISPALSATLGLVQSPMIPLCLFLLPIISVCFAAPNPGGQRVNTALGSFYLVRPTLPGSSIKLLLALAPSNIDGLHEALRDVSDPRSLNYGKYLSKEAVRTSLIHTSSLFKVYSIQVERFVAPTQESARAVKDWLTNNDISVDVASPSGDLLRIELPAEVANQLLHANFTYFLHEDTNTTVVRTLSYKVPPTVQDHLSFIYPTTQFLPPTSSSQSSFEIIEAPYDFKRTSGGRKRSSVPRECSQYITPECLQDMYSIPSMPATARGNTIAVSGFLDEVATGDDLRRFSNIFRPDIAHPTFTTISVENGRVDGPGTPEATLDIDYTVGLATEVPVKYISVGNFRYDGLLDLTSYLLGQDQPPLVLTTSYGIAEGAFEQFPEMAQMICNAYAQLGARGTTVIFSSGDGGVSGHKVEYSDQCDSGRSFAPTFPSTCPFVTSVGGTRGVNPEVAAEFSSGGFSNLFARPDYQNAAVEGYLAALGNTYAGRFNASGRAFPDVSAQAVHYVVNVQDQFYAVNGTSAASPAFASVIALLNNQRLNAGQPPLGFLNPLLYSVNASAAFNDIAIGSNPGCGTDGFPARSGWDPVTGLGTPAYNRLLSVALGVASPNSGSTSRFSIKIPFELPRLL